MVPKHLSQQQLVMTNATHVKYYLIGAIFISLWNFRHCQGASELPGFQTVFFESDVPKICVGAPSPKKYGYMSNALQKNKRDTDRTINATNSA